MHKYKESWPGVYISEAPWPPPSETHSPQNRHHPISCTPTGSTRVTPLSLSVQAFLICIPLRRHPPPSTHTTPDNSHPFLPPQPSCPSSQALSHTCVHPLYVLQDACSYTILRTGLQRSKTGCKYRSTQGLLCMSSHDRRGAHVDDTKPP